MDPCVTQSSMSHHSAKGLLWQVTGTQQVLVNVRFMVPAGERHRGGQALPPGRWPRAADGEPGCGLSPRNAPEGRILLP